MKANQTDRYVSYRNIDCAGNAKTLMIMLRKHIDDPQKSNVFWERCREQLAQAVNPQGNHGRHVDELFLIHPYINNRYEIFETCEDPQALTLLDQIERECC